MVALRIFCAGHGRANLRSVLSFALHLEIQ